MAKQRHRDSRRPYVVVVGGSNLDIKARVLGPTIAATSNPGAAMVSAGGVGRNIAHTLARLGIATRLISLVGKDLEGDRLLRETAAAGVDVAAVARAHGATGLYVATLDRTGELVIGVSAMRIIEGLTPARLVPWRRTIEGAAFLVADCNLGLAALRWLQARAAAQRIPFLVEPVSAPKAAKLAALLKAKRPIHTMTPNLIQLAVLTGGPIEGDAALRRAAVQLHERGVGHLLIGLGREGALFSSAVQGKIRQHRIPAAAAKARDVTGGGDALVAGYVAALMRGAAPLDAALFGQAAAGLAVAAADTVSGKIAPAVLQRRAAGLRRKTREM